jgi:hypothetical protein
MAQSRPQPAFVHYFNHSDSSVTAEPTQSAPAPHREHFNPASNRESATASAMPSVVNTDLPDSSSSTVAGTSISNVAEFALPSFTTTEPTKFVNRSPGMDASQWTRIENTRHKRTRKSSYVFDSLTLLTSPTEPSSKGKPKVIKVPGVAGSDIKTEGGKVSV